MNADYILSIWNKSEEHLGCNYVMRCLAWMLKARLGSAQGSGTPAWRDSKMLTWTKWEIWWAEAYSAVPVIGRQISSYSHHCFSQSRIGCCNAKWSLFLLIFGLQTSCHITIFVQAKWPCRLTVSAYRGSSVQNLIVAHEIRPLGSKMILLWLLNSQMKWDQELQWGNHITAAIIELLIALCMDLDVSAHLQARPTTGMSSSLENLNPIQESLLKTTWNLSSLCRDCIQKGGRTSTLNICTLHHEE